ncbi:MAG: T9SS type A sorting domain-containing protein [Bacteroidota bacterium]
MKHIILLTFTVIHLFAYSQNEGLIWHFGDGASLDFSSGTPVAGSGSNIFARDNSSTVSDINGNLLFYTNGETIYNSLHAVMSNGNAIGGHQSGGQPAVILPQPGSSGIYYVFTVGQYASSAGFRYTIVDMNQAGGLGAVTAKGVLLTATSTERIDVTRNPANNSYWVLTHGWGNNQFYAYELSSSGLNLTPVTSSIGSIHSGGVPSGYNAMGQMTFSKDGSKLVCGIYSMGRFELFDFDNLTGVVSNMVAITGHPNAWGAAFSPDGTRLYVSRWLDDKVWQLNLQAGNATAVNASSTVVGTATFSLPVSGAYRVGYLQLGPDDKLYIAKFDQADISVIDNPNNLGTACGFVDVGVNLGSGICFAGLSRTILDNQATVLSAENLGFQAIYKDEKIHLSWTTELDHDAHLFGLERSDDNGTSFKQINSFEALNIRDTDPVTYIAADDDYPAHSKRLFYRLTAFHVTGDQIVSEMASVLLPSLSGTVDFHVFPNPTHDEIWIDSFGQQVRKISMWDQQGRLVWEKNLSQRGQFRLGIQDLPAGLYFVRVLSDVSLGTKQFIKN